MSFDFGGAESWETSTDTMLSVGNHVCTIVQADPGWTRSKDKPQIDLKVENSDGDSMRDWIQITPNTVGKVVQVFDAAGVARPQEGEFNAQSGELTEQCCARLRGKKIGVVVREQDKYGGEPDEKVARIAGYVTPERIKGDVPADRQGLSNSGGQMAGVGSSQVTGEDDIPFLRDDAPFEWDVWHGCTNR